MSMVRSEHVESKESQKKDGVRASVHCGGDMCLPWIESIGAAFIDMIKTRRAWVPGKAIATTATAGKPWCKRIQKSAVGIRIRWF
jgi:hypothetical protein